jgi:DUF1680 family protein
MTRNLTRRDFVKAVPLAALTVSQISQGLAQGTSTSPTVITKIGPLDRDVRLLESRWQKQYQAARDFYAALPEDDILHGYRKAAGLPAPGKTLGGWCEQNSNTVFGQWLSGMSRMYRATGDTAMRDKAVRLFTEWSKTVKPDGDCGMRHYAYEKLVCGLVDMKRYADVAEAIPMLEKVTDWAAKTLSRENVPGAMQRGLYQGRPSEWYTLAENLYRAFLTTRNRKFKDFGDAWLYPAYWDKFADNASPPDAHGRHAYSHVNSFSSAAMAYAVTGNEKYLRIIKNAYDYLQNTQCYATGGYGPSEIVMALDGALGRSLETRQDSFETPCGSWAVFKLSRYLMQFTGEARYGDWMERIFYNGIGSALPTALGGKTFYYSDYRVGGGMKVYNWEWWTCCSGSYIQGVAGYHDIIYFKDADFNLYVNLYVASEVTWARPEGEVKVVQQTNYPEAETSKFKVELKNSTRFGLKFRIPEWAQGASIKVNGNAANVECKPGTWAVIERAWNNGDAVEVTIPLSLRMLPVDKQHPNRVAVVRGPTVLVFDTAYHDNAFRLPGTDSELNKWLVADQEAGSFRVEPPDGSRVRSKFLPFYSVGQDFPYKMYLDKDRLPMVLW